MTDDLLVLGALWCFAVFCFGFGWIMGHAAAMGTQADTILGRRPVSDDVLREMRKRIRNRHGKRW